MKENKVMILLNGKLHDIMLLFALIINDNNLELTERVEV